MTKRKAFTKAQRAAVKSRQDGRCARPGCEAEIVDIDHVVPVALDGLHALANFEGLCKPHHLEKTKADVRRIANAKRQAKMMLPREPAKRPIQGRSNWPQGRKLQGRGFQKRERP